MCAQYQDFTNTTRIIVFQKNQRHKLEYAYINNNSILSYYSEDFKYISRMERHHSTGS
jgi:hypothetical protein